MRIPILTVSFLSNVLGGQSTAPPPPSPLPMPTHFCYFAKDTGLSGPLQEFCPFTKEFLKALHPGLSEHKKPVKPTYKIVNDVYHYQLLTFINSIIHYLVSEDKNNACIAKNITLDIFQGHIAYTMKKVNVNKIFMPCICVDANVSIKFI